MDYKVPIGHREEVIIETKYWKPALACFGIGIAFLMVAFIATQNLWLVVLIEFVLFTTSIVCFYLYLKERKKQKIAFRYNSYSELAIYYENESIYIDEGRLIEIKCADIVSVEHTISDADEGYGDIVIVTKDNKYIAHQIADIDVVAKNVLYWKDPKSKFSNEGTEFILYPNDEFVSVFTKDGIKVSFSYYKDSENTDLSLETADKIKEDLDYYYKTILEKTVSKLVRRKDSLLDDEYLNKDYIKDKLSEEQSISFILDGEDFQAVFEDYDEMFGGVYIIYEGNINTDEFRVEIE
ncbi:MAG: hypothetical protein E7351_03365 [Clostridiales bacterium]|nr:hypothetical protein [Clostridiales bacterium]